MFGMCSAESLGPSQASSLRHLTLMLYTKRNRTKTNSVPRLSVNLDMKKTSCEGSHRAHSADACVHGPLPVALLCGLLGEEEVDFVIVSVAVVWDEVGGDEPGVCGGVKTWETRGKQSVLK